MVKLEGLTKRFPNGHGVFDLDLELADGEIVGYLGPNGAGKTTLFNIISGAIPLKSGTVRFKGKPINGLSPNDICKRGIARTFQLIKIFGYMTVYENVLMGSLFGTSGKTSTREAAARTRSLLEFMELASYSNYIAKDLTFVNQKKVEVARALATSPDLLMLDEFMAGLNQTEVMQGVELVRKIRDRGITVLMIEHVMTAIMSVCNRVIVLHHGEKIAEGTPVEIANNRSVIEVYFGE